MDTYRFTNTIVEVDTDIVAENIATAKSRYNTMFGNSADAPYINVKMVDAPVSPNPTLFNCEIVAMATARKAF